jgi:hypothetical protein
MKLKAVFLVASAVSFVKPFLIGMAAVGIGLTGSGALASSFLRYLIFPHTVAAVCFLFLAWDETKYQAFKPLVALVAAGSLVALLASLIPVAANPEKAFLVSGDAKSLSVSAVSSFFIMLIDIFSLIVLTPRRKRERGADRGSSDLSPAPSVPSKEP